MSDPIRNLQRRLRHAVTLGRADLLARAFADGAQPALAADTFWDLASRAASVEALAHLGTVLPLPSNALDHLTAAVEANRPANVAWWRDQGTPWHRDDPSDSVLISALLAGQIEMLAWLGAQGVRFPARPTWSPLVHAFRHPVAQAQALIERAVELGADPRQLGAPGRHAGNVLQAWIQHAQATRRTVAEVGVLWSVLAAWVEPDATEGTGRPSARAQLKAQWGQPDWLIAWDRQRILAAQPPSQPRRERARS